MIALGDKRIGTGWIGKGENWERKGLEEARIERKGDGER